MNKQQILAITLCLMAASSFAAAPVVNLGNASDAGGEMPTPSAMMAAPIQQSLSLDQRLAQLERQVNNMAKLNLSGQLDTLSQKMEQLNGQLQVQAHSIQTLDQQQRNFYQDLNQRLSELRNLVNNGSTSLDGMNSTTTNSSASSTSSAAQSAAASNGKSSAKKASSPKKALSDEQAYQAAFRQLTANQLNQAESSFKHFLTQYPKSRYLANAHYWLGEIYLKNEQNKAALAEFNTVIQQYASNSKVPDALLKRALIYSQQGDGTKAKADLKTILQNYPKSSAADLAKIKQKALDLNSQSATAAANTTN